MLPTILLVMLMLVQPGIILYDRAVMEAAASEACRLIETLQVDDEDAALAAIERRLSAIPGADIFHAGSWTIEISGGEGEAEATVSISHSLRPLPLIGAGMGFLGMTNAQGLYTQEVSRTVEVLDEWVVSSEYGADPEAWIERWEGKA